MYSYRWSAIFRFFLLTIIPICQNYKYISTDTALVLLVLLMLWSLVSFVRHRKQEPNKIPSVYFFNFPQIIYCLLFLVCKFAHL